MEAKFMGDSFDLVKRFWAEALGRIAPLYAHPQFVPVEIRESYQRLTTIPVLPTHPQGGFGILLDPHTGIPLPLNTGRASRLSHATLSFIARVNEELHP